MGTDTRRVLLEAWARNLHNAAVTGKITGRRLQILDWRAIAGPRVGVLEIDTGDNAPRAIRALGAQNMALARQFVPREWEYWDDPNLFLQGRYIRMEVTWPAGMEEADIPLSRVAQRPDNGRSWVVGKNEWGSAVVMSINDSKAHILFAGTTGSGKSWSLRCAVAQLSRGRGAQNRFILIDGKDGDGLWPVRYTRGMVAPLAISLEDARNALYWAYQEMRRRQKIRARGGDISRDGNVIIVIDEFQEYVKSGDAAIAELLRRIAAKGRSANVHLLLGTQHPTADSFGDPSTKRNVTGRLAFLVGDPQASLVAVGGKSPRADKLKGRGDLYAITPARKERAQAVYIPENELTRPEQWPKSEPVLEAYPEYDPEELGLEPADQAGSAGSLGGFSPEELAEGLIVAANGKGRPTLQKAIGAGSSKSERLLTVARQINSALVSKGLYLQGCDE